MAVCEPSCFNEPVIVYQKGNVFNLYQNMIEQELEYECVAVDTDNLQVRVGPDS